MDANREPAGEAAAPGLAARVAAIRRHLSGDWRRLPPNRRRLAVAAATGLVVFAVTASLLVVATSGGSGATPPQSMAAGSPSGGPASPTDQRSSWTAEPTATPAAPTATPVEPTATPAGPGMTWAKGGPAKVRYSTGIISTPTGFLAVLVLGPDESGLFYSTDLIHWTTPTEEVFVNEDTLPFLPTGPLPVKTGYAADGTTVPWTSGYEWYSADGIHWHTGIPDEVRIPEPKHPEYYPERLDYCHYTGWDPGCVYVEGLVIAHEFDADGPYTVVSLDGGNHWSRAILPDGAHIMWVQRFSSGIFVGGVYDILTSSDGITWARSDMTAGQFLAIGDAGYALKRDRPGIKGQQHVWRTTDHGRTWTQMFDAAGAAVGGEQLEAAGQTVLVMSASDLHGTYRTIMWVGTPQD